MIQVRVKPHPYFKRDQSDIHTDLYISISDVSKTQTLISKTTNLFFF